MLTRTLNICSSCFLETIEYMDETIDVRAIDCYLNYTEHSPDPYYSNTETCHEISREKAIEIIEFLKTTYNL